MNPMRAILAMVLHYRFGGVYGYLIIPGWKMVAFQVHAVNDKPHALCG